MRTFKHTPLILLVLAAAASQVRLLADVAIFQDDFSSANLDSGKWNTGGSGSVTQSGGRLSIVGPAWAISKQSFARESGGGSLRLAFDNISRGVNTMFSGLINAGIPPPYGYSPGNSVNAGFTASTDATGPYIGFACNGQGKDNTPGTGANRDLPNLFTNPQPLFRCRASLGPVGSNVNYQVDTGSGFVPLFSGAGYAGAAGYATDADLASTRVLLYVSSGTAIFDNVQLTYLTNSVTINSTVATFTTAAWQIQMQDGNIINLFNKRTGASYIQSPDSGSAVKTAALYWTGANSQSGFGPLEDISVAASNNETYGTALTITQTGPFEVSWTFTNSGISSSVVAWIDPTTRDLCVRQSSSGTGTNLLRLRWALTGISKSLKVILPVEGGVGFFNGDPGPSREYFIWPYRLSAQFVILQGTDQGFWGWSDDTQYNFKGIELDRRRSLNAIGFDTEAPCPFNQTSAMTGVIWRFNTYQGNANQGSWSLPVHRFREWMAEAWQFSARPAWIKDIRLALFNTPVPGAEIAFNELAQVTDPHHVLVGATSWRAEQWGANWPAYTMAAGWNAAQHQLRNQGCRTMIWLNPIQCQKYMPEYNTYRSWEMTNPFNSTQQLALWDPNTAYIHIGLPAWRQLICSRIAAGAVQMTLKPNAVMLDESFGIYQDSHNGTINGMNNGRGMVQFHADLLETVPGTSDGLTLAGENLSELTAIHESFAHIHGYGGYWQSVSNGMRWVVPRANQPLLIPVFSVLFSPYTHCYGYWGLDGIDDYSTQCNEAYKILRLEPFIGQLPYDEQFISHIFTLNNHTQMSPVIKDIIDRVNGVNTHKPTLQFASVTPATGTPQTQFNFHVVYRDLDNEGPVTAAGSYVRAVIDGMPYDLDPTQGNLYTSGVQFALSQTGLAAGPNNLHFANGFHQVHFEAWDTWTVVRFPENGEITFNVSSTSGPKTISKTWNLYH